MIFFVLIILAPTVEYYKLATMSDNHAVREAACACIAELASKISSVAVSPYVNTLLDTLLICFQDDSWPVRDGKEFQFKEQFNAVTTNKN